MHRLVLLAVVLTALGCASEPVPHASERAGDPAAILDFAMRARIERIALGQSEPAAREILGSDPVQRPGHPEAPLPSPLRALALRTRDGAALRIELYVVAARAAEGCPDVHVESAPVVFRDGVVAAKSWEAVEARWRDWGGSLAELRAARDTYQCPDPPAAVAPR
jgi:hypothetical protein